jgi:hypothetical protein
MIASIAHRSLALLALAVLAASVCAGPATAAEPVTSIGWTKTYTEAILLLRLRVPCRNIRSTQACSVQAAQDRLTLSERRLAACKARATASAKAARCTEAADAANARTNLAEIRRGFPIRTADCTGGAKTKTGPERYSAFRCTITVEDDSNGGGPVVVSGRLLVTVTGKATFAWQAL